MSAGKALADVKVIPLLQKTQAANLPRVQGKGDNLFARLVAAHAGKKTGSKPGPTAAELKKVLKTTPSGKHAAQGLSEHKLAVPAPHGPHAPSAAGSAGAPIAAGTAGRSENEKLDPRKKLGKSHISAAGNPEGGNLGGDAALPGLKLMEGQQRKKEDAAALPVSAVASRTAGAHAPKVLVVDLRKKVQGQAAEDSGPGLKTQPASTDKGPSLPLLSKTAVLDAEVSATGRHLPVDLSAHETPVERLREMAGSELLRASTMVLKDGGGEIRLVLRPESLGSVRIRMNVVDNSIDGKIIVDNSTVKQIFDGNIDALKRALTAEGFQMGSLQVSVGSQSGENARQQEQERPAEVRRVAALDFERNVPGVENLSLGELMVNLFV